MLAMVNPDMENFKPDFLRGINLLKTVIVSGLSGNCLQVNQKMSSGIMLSVQFLKQTTKSASPVIWFQLQISDTK